MLNITAENGKGENDMEQNKNVKQLTLTGQTRQFTAKDGRKIEYVALTVEVMGINVDLQARDNTGRQLLATYFKGGNSNETA